MPESFDVVDLECVECGRVIGRARLSGDERAVHVTDSGGVADNGGISVGGWEYGALIEPICPECSDGDPYA